MARHNCNPLAEFGKSLDDADVDEWFEAFAERNSDMAEYEISSTGHLMIREPTGSPGSAYEIQLAGDLMIWARQRGGVTYGPSSRFICPDGSRFGPDAAWIREERRNELMLPENRPFARIVPDFIAEIKSPSNSNVELVKRRSKLFRARNPAGVVHRPRNPQRHQVPPGPGTGSPAQPGVHRRR